MKTVASQSPWKGGQLKGYDQFASAHHTSAVNGAGQAVVEHVKEGESGEPLALVAVAAILVASIRLRFADALLHLRDRGINPIACAHVAKRGDELGWFEHGSTIIVLAPQGTRLAASLSTGQHIRMGEVLLESDRC